VSGRLFQDRVWRVPNELESTGQIAVSGRRTGLAAPVGPRGVATTPKSAGGKHTIGVCGSPAPSHPSGRGNASYFHARLEAAAHSRRTGEPLALAIIDLDQAAGLGVALTAPIIVPGPPRLSAAPRDPP
jgi:hypothetical protein